MPSRAWIVHNTGSTGQGQRVPDRGFRSSGLALNRPQRNIQPCTLMNMAQGNAPAWTLPFHDHVSPHGAGKQMRVRGVVQWTQRQ